MASYMMNERVSFVYENAPVPEEEQYKRGQHVHITEVDDDGGSERWVGTYEVLNTDHTIIWGKIVEVPQ